MGWLLFVWQFGSSTWHIASLEDPLICVHQKIWITGSASTVLMVTGQIAGIWRILTPCRIETPEPIAKKIWRNWLHLREDSVNQIYYKSIQWGLLDNGWNRTFLCFLYLYLYLFTFLWESPIWTIWMDYHLSCTIAQITWNSTKMCLLGLN